MTYKNFPVIDMSATGRNIKRLRLEKGLSVRQLQSYFGFDEPQAIYKWQRGESLPSVDNLYALGNILDVPMEQILVPVTLTLNNKIKQQDNSCCSVFSTGCFECGKRPNKEFNHFRGLHPFPFFQKDRCFLQKSSGQSAAAFKSFSLDTHTRNSYHFLIETLGWKEELREFDAFIVFAKG